MKIGIAIIAYNRSEHLSKVLHGLQQNEGVKQLYLFQDGLKDESDYMEWEATNRVLHGVNWCNTKIYVSETNKGLAKSIVSSINKVLEKNDAIIVLEDDCVPHPDFVSFMTQCFEKYKDNKEIYSISGYSWPIHAEKNKSDIYFCGRFSSWGWGTWKDRWETYSEDYTLIRRIKNDSKKSNNLALWGQDLENMLVDNLKGNINSWAVFMALTVIEGQGKCINPYMPLIENIGCDGSGVHCGIVNQNEQMFCGRMHMLTFPENNEISQDIKRGFTTLYGNPIAFKQENKQLPKAVIYGLGNFYHKNERLLCDKYDITGYIDNIKKGYYAGKKIVKYQRAQELQYDYLVIMIQDLKECMRVIKNLIVEQNITSCKIILGYHAIDFKDGYIEKLKIGQDGNFIFETDHVQIKLNSIDEINNVSEVWKNHTYLYNMNNQKKDVIIDVGMNIADSILYFLQDENVEKIYGFEPFPQTFRNAKINLEKSGFGEDKRVTTFNYGLSDVNEEREIVFNENMTCGQSTIMKVNEKVHENYENQNLISNNENIITKIKVRKSSEVIRNIIEGYSKDNIILKIDCEGEEYVIFKELDETKMLSRIDFIMLEWHYLGKENLVSILEKNKFSYWCYDKSKDMGMIYARKI